MTAAIRSAWIARLMILLVILIGCPELGTVRLSAQTPAPRLFIAIVEGDGQINSIRMRTSREPIIEVQDENHKPVAGAIVSFTLPNSGPGGVFANGSRLLTVTTDANGRAAATGLKVNSAKGSYQIRVTASSQGRTATASIAQSNIAAAAGAGAASGGLFGLGLPLTIAIAGAVVAGVTVGVVKATGGGSSTRVSVGQPSLP